ncbi:uncharacterized protein [Macrobrachium rosenbergii]|uniref:uncharacterized protein n=1 Tax=Macrobrachium rosenbergii TaxID=79674 RepID=UPI0034D79A67
MSAPISCWGPRDHTTTAINPAANSLVEWFHRSLKASSWPAPPMTETSAAGSSSLENRPRADSAPRRTASFCPCKRDDTGRSATFTPPELSSATHVFVRVDAVCPPLTRPYRGPFRVLERNSKAFLLALPGRNDWVSVDRLKAAFLEESTSVTAAPSPPSRPSPRPAPRKRRTRGRPRKGPPAPATQHPHARETPPLSSRSRGTLQHPSRYTD